MRWIGRRIYHKCLDSFITCQVMLNVFSISGSEAKWCPPALLSSLLYRPRFPPFDRLTCSRKEVGTAKKGSLPLDRSFSKVFLACQTWLVELPYNQQACKLIFRWKELTSYLWSFAAGWLVRTQQEQYMSSLNLNFSL